MMTKLKVPILAVFVYQSVITSTPNDGHNCI